MGFEGLSLFAKGFSSARASKQDKAIQQALDVNFQEVVHSAPAVNADVAKHTVIRGGPNGHA